MNQIDLFRLNCFFNDSEANDLKTILKSLLCESLYENNNREMELSLILSNLTETLKLNIDLDLIHTIISNERDFKVHTLDKDHLVQLTPEKFNQIDINVKEQSIEKYIKEFIAVKQLPSHYNQRITEILQIALYENINSFSTNDLKSIIPVNANKRFNQIELDIFNEFLDYDDAHKNTALYNTFLKAVEFSIVTSGRGINKLNKDLLKGKTYLLDTNIIFRLLGIGGRERQESLVGLIKSCNHQGITFAYTLKTYTELKSKLSQIINALKGAESKGQIKIIGDLLETSSMYFNNDFITHYSTLRKTGEVTTPANYEIKLLQNFKSLATGLNFQEANDRTGITDNEVAVFATKLIKDRKAINEYYKYSRTAAKVDAFNILYVRYKRGFNNYNYTDIKSFYLTTDRSLNKILSGDSINNIPETILPSQLYLLHNPYSNTTDEIDYKLFVLFLKRRTTEFKYRGVDVLNYIGQIRQHSHDEHIAKEVLKVYADRRFDYSKDLALNDTGSFIPFQQFKEEYFDTLTAKYKEGHDSYLKLKNDAFERLQSYINISRNLTRLLDVLIYLAIPVACLAIKNQFTSLTFYVLIISVEILKFFITKVFQILKPIWSAILLFYLKKSPYYRITKDEELLTTGLKILKSKNFNPWS